MNISDVSPATSNPGELPLQQPERLLSLWGRRIVGRVQAVQERVQKKLSRECTWRLYRRDCLPLMLYNVQNLYQEGGVFLRDVSATCEEVAAYVVQQMRDRGGSKKGALAACHFLRGLGDGRTAFQLVQHMDSALFADPLSLGLRRLDLFFTKISPEVLQEVLPIVHYLVSLPRGVSKLAERLSALERRPEDFCGLGGEFFLGVVDTLRAIESILDTRTRRQGPRIHNLCLDILKRGRDQAEVKSLGHVLMKILRDITDREMLGVLKFLERVEGAERVQILRYLVDMPKNVTDHDGRWSFIKAMVALGQERLADVLEHAKQFLDRALDGYEGAEILTAIGNVPREKRAQVLALVLRLVEGRQEGAVTVGLVQFLSAIRREEERESLVQLLLRLANGKGASYPLLLVGRALSCIEDGARRETVVDLVEGLEDDILGGASIPEVIEILGGVSDEEERRNVVACIPYLMRKASGVSQGLSALRGMLLLPVAVRGKKELQREVLQLFWGISTYHDKALAFMENVPEEERADLIRLTALLVKNLPQTTSSVGLMQVADLFFRHPYEASSLQHVVRAYHCLMREGAEALLEAVRSIPPQERMVRVQLAVERGKSSIANDSFAIFLSFVIHFSEETLKRRASEIALVCSVKFRRRQSEVLQGLALIPPEQKQTYLEALFALNRPSHADLVLPKVLELRPELRVKIQNFLLRSLEDLVDQEEAYRLSEHLLTLQTRTALGLHDEHPLFQKAIEVYILSNPREWSGRVNPYRVYHQLRCWSEEDSLVDAVVGESIVAGQRVQWDLSGLRERAKPVEYTQGDLAEGVELSDSSGGKTTIFSRIYHQLQERLFVSLDPLPEEEGKRVEAIENFLDNPSVQRLLHPKTKSVSIYTWQLYQIGLALSRAGRDLQDGERFTEQEEMLMALAESVRFCFGGVREGVGGYFNHLPVQYKGDRRVFVTSDTEKKVLSYVEGKLQQYMANVFANLDFLGELGHTDAKHAERQGHHWSLFAKNLLFRQVGYAHHALQFDQHAGMLSRTLTMHLKCSRNIRRAVEIYFTYLRVAHLAKEIKKGIDGDLRKEAAEQKIGLTALAFFLSKGGSESTLPLFTEGYIEDLSKDGDYTGPYAITEKGVLALLTTAQACTCSRPLTVQVSGHVRGCERLPHIPVDSR